MNFNHYAPNSIAVLKSRGCDVSIDARSSHCGCEYRIFLDNHADDEDFSIYFSTYPGFCGGAMMYYIPSKNYIPKNIYEQVVELCKEFIKNALKDYNRFHVVVAYASDEDRPGQEEFLQDIGFESVQEFVSTKSGHLVRRYELVLATPAEMERVETGREERLVREQLYSL